MMFLNSELNPDNFIKDLDYLSGIHSKHLSEFIQKKFSKNANNMEPKKVDLAKLYIGNQSNIYSNEVDYGVDIASEIFSYLRLKKNEQSKLEKYLNLNKQALLWTYVRRNKLRFKALHCSEYYIDTDNFFNQVDLSKGPYTFRYSVSGNTAELEAKGSSTIYEDLRIDRFVCDTLFVTRPGFSKSPFTSVSSFGIGFPRISSLFSSTCL
jgi:hypothetical protein